MPDRSLGAIRTVRSSGLLPLGRGGPGGQGADPAVVGSPDKGFGEPSTCRGYQWLLDRVEPDSEKQRIIGQQLTKGVNAFQTSSLGRVFDAVAAMVGLGTYNHFDAQLPIALEAIAASGCGVTITPLSRVEDRRTGTSGPGPTIRQMVHDVEQGCVCEPDLCQVPQYRGLWPPGHGQLAREKTGLEAVALSGGSSATGIWRIV